MMLLSIISATDLLCLHVYLRYNSLITSRSVKDEHSEWEKGGNKLWSPQSRNGFGTPQSVRDRYWQSFA